MNSRGHLLFVIGCLAGIFALSGTSCPPTYIYDFPGSDTRTPSGDPLPGPQGEDGVSCWDLNGNGIGDSNEDINRDGNFNALDCQGEDGTTGLPGTNGLPGANGQPGINGQPGLNGQAGVNGIPGISCWDLNGNGLGDPEEDVNGDGNFDALDCQGEDGENGKDGQNGLPGANGLPGIACWDLNGNGVGDTSEDINGDGNFDALDCQGTDGQSGLPGANGQFGISCWDLNGNGIGDPEEDVNVDGNYDALDCKGQDAFLDVGPGLQIIGDALALDTAYTDLLYWSQTGNFGTSAGTQFLGTVDDQPMDLRVNNLRAFRLEPGVESPNLIGGHGANDVSTGAFGASIGGGGYASGPNRITDNYGTIGGGRENLVGDDSGSTETSPDATVAGGRYNAAMAWAATVGGGFSNQADGTYATIGGGLSNLVSGSAATVNGGQHNQVLNPYGTIAGGSYNQSRHSYGTIGGGANNIVGENTDPFLEGFATIPGGLDNEALADYSFAAGRQAKINAMHSGAFLYADNHNLPFASAAANEFAVRATGGFRLVTAIDGAGTPTAGAVLPSGSGSWSSLSDRTAKDNFEPIDSQTILEKLCKLPIEKWNYRSQNSSIHHLGPMAQDFYSSFGLGEDERHISSVDADGIALAAIQGLNKIVQEKQHRIDAQQQQIKNLENEIATLREQLSKENSEIKAKLEAIQAALANQTTADVKDKE